MPRLHLIIAKQGQTVWSVEPAEYMGIEVHGTLNQIVVGGDCQGQEEDHQRNGTATVTAQSSGCRVVSSQLR